MRKSREKTSKKKERVNLWHSEKKAQKGGYFFIPIDGGKKVIKCTGITLDDEPPSDSSEFLFEAFLPIIRQEAKKRP